MLATVLQPEGGLIGQTPQIRATAAQPEAGCTGIDQQAGRGLLRGPFPGMLAQRMGDLVPHDGRNLVIGQVELLDDAAVERDLATRHAPGIELVGLDDVDLPLPLQRILPERPHLRDDAPRHRPHPGGHGRVGIEPTVRLRLLQHFGIGHLRTLIQLRLRDQRRHHLPPFQANGTFAGGMHGSTGRQQQAAAQCGQRKPAGTGQTLSLHRPG